MSDDDNCQKPVIKIGNQTLDEYLGGKIQHANETFGPAALEKHMRNSRDKPFSRGR